MRPSFGKNRSRQYVWQVNPTAFYMAIELEIMDEMEHWLASPAIETTEFHNCQRLYWMAQSRAIGWASR